MDKQLLEQINQDINKIVENRELYNYYNCNEMKCENLKLAKEQIEIAKKNIKKYAKILEQHIKTYINYPKGFFDGFFPKVRVYTPKTDMCLIRISFIDKQEYYCIKIFFKKHEYVKEYWEKNTYYISLY